MMGQETRNKLTDYWKDHEVTKEDEYAVLTNIIHQEWSGVSVKKHKDIKINLLPIPPPSVSSASGVPASLHHPSPAYHGEDYILMGKKRHLNACEDFHCKCQQGNAYDYGKRPGNWGILLISKSVNGFIQQ